MDNMKIYNESRNVPPEAQKLIEAGKLKNMTDINPMWRIKKLTELFGPCGIGWYVEKSKEWTEKNQNGEVAVFLDINLFIKENGEWTKALFGTGGSMLISLENKTDWETKEKTKQLVINDEAFKMAYTDALSVCCKMLGIGADVYFAKDRTKYTSVPEEKPVESKPAKSTTPMHNITLDSVKEAAKAKGITDDLLEKYCIKKYNKTAENLTIVQQAELLAYLKTKPDKE